MFQVYAICWCFLCVVYLQLIDIKVHQKIFTISTARCTITCRTIQLYLYIYYVILYIYIHTTLITLYNLTDHELRVICISDHLAHWRRGAAAPGDTPQQTINHKPCSDPKRVSPFRHTCTSMLHRSTQRMQQRTTARLRAEAIRYN